RHTRFSRDWSSDVCSSDLGVRNIHQKREAHAMSAQPPAKTETGLPDPVIIPSADPNEEPIVIPALIVAANAAYDRDLPAMLKTRSEERRVGAEWRIGGAAV